MNSPNNMPSNVLTELQRSYGDIAFKEADEFYWSPKNSTVYYNQQALETSHGIWALLHEVSHGIAQHKTYQADFELLLYEVEAWEYAKQIAGNYGLKIDPEHVEQCLDTYRDWLYARSTCINCQVNSFQISPQIYMCINCTDTWRVSSSRFCRPYRKKHRS